MYPTAHAPTMESRKGRLIRRVGGAKDAQLGWSAVGLISAEVDRLPSGWIVDLLWWVSTPAYELWDAVMETIQLAVFA